MESEYSDFEFLIKFIPKKDGDFLAWAGIANKQYYELTRNPSEQNILKLNTILELANKYQCTIPDQQFKAGWEFVESIHRDKLTDEQIKDAINEFTRTIRNANAKIV